MIPTEVRTNVLRIEEVEKPKPQDDEVLVRVHTSSVNIAEWYGMTITKQLIRSHAGTIEAQSETGKGSTFVIEIPEQMQERPSSGDTLGSGL